MRTDNKICMGLHAGKVWYLDLVICSNAEVLFSAAEDPSGNGHADEARLAVNAAQDAIWAACNDYAAKNNDFSAWNGGRYGGQRNAYGYQAWSGLAFRLLSAEPNEDGEDNQDDDSIVVRVADAPGEVREIVDRICCAASDAITKIVNQTLKSA